MNSAAIFFFSIFGIGSEEEVIEPVVKVTVVSPEEEIIIEYIPPSYNVYEVGNFVEE